MTWKDRKIATLQGKRIYWRNKSNNLKALLIISVVINILLLMKLWVL